MEGYYLMPHPPLMIPEIGKGQEEQISSTIKACKKIGEQVEALGVETLIVITPHGVVFRDGIAIVSQETLNGDMSKFGVPQVQMTQVMDLKLTQTIIQKATEKHLVTAPLDENMARQYGIQLELDHGAMVPLYYMKNKAYKLVHITYGMLSPLELYAFGQAIEEAVTELGRKAVLIASGDLSHRLTEGGPYPYSPYGMTFDKKLIELLEQGDMKGVVGLSGKLVTEAGECGLRSLQILAGALDGKTVKGEVLSYEGPFGVGYGVVDFKASKGNSLYEELVKEREKSHEKKMERGNDYVKLARKSLDYFFKYGVSMPLNQAEWQVPFEEAKGVFVSIKKHGELRGCIGTTSPTTPSVAEEIVQNAISAATRDPRFAPMTRDELLDATLSVDVLGEAEPAHKEMLNPSEYGVIVTKGERRGLLLPHLEGIDTVEQQLEIALQKAGIRPDEAYSIERFKVVRFEEDV